MKMTTGEIKKKVLKEIEKTENLVKKYKELAKPVTSSGAVGRVSRMNAINNDTVITIPLNNAKVKLSNLRKVLSRIGSAKFGKCLNCNKAIALGRILARPESLRCVKCAK